MDLSDTTSDPDIMDSVGFHGGISQSLLTKSPPFIQPVTSQDLLTEAHMERYSMTFKNSVVNQPTAQLWHLNILCFHLFLSESSAASFQTDWIGLNRGTGQQTSLCILSLLACLITLLSGLLKVWKVTEMCGVMDYRSRRIASVKSRRRAFVLSLLSW